MPFVTTEVFPNFTSDTPDVIAPTVFATNSVVAICVVLVPVVAVGAVGVPVSAGDANGALVVSLGWTWSSAANRFDVPVDAVPSINGVALGLIFCRK